MNGGTLNTMAGAPHLLEKNGGVLGNCCYKSVSYDEIPDVRKFEVFWVKDEPSSDINRGFSNHICCKSIGCSLFPA
jgi:hypothetical protein